MFDEWAVAELAWLHLWGFRQKFELRSEKVHQTVRCTWRIVCTSWVMLG